MSSKGLAPDAHATLLLGLSLAGHIISNVHMALLPLVYLLFFFNMDVQILHVTKTLKESGRIYNMAA
ncbi:hypothetical protein SOVF_109170 [Spinacia oleracea]|nr:hypothetical protein SOVF_109170 [Spinacia oleracea]